MTHQRTPRQPGNAVNALREMRDRKNALEAENRRLLAEMVAAGRSDVETRSKIASNQAEIKSVNSTLRAFGM